MKTDAKSFLQQVERCNARIDEQLEELDQLRALSTKITATFQLTGNSPPDRQEDKIGNAVARIEEMEYQISTNIDRLTQIKEEVIAVIDQLQDTNEYRIIANRYLLFKPLQAIAEEMYMSYRHICRLHAQALQTVHSILDRERE